ncbi:MerC domain-containing protein [Pedobacter jamesrossensis]|uniref:MerC domain-containing protein n=1 Tax=Pedobacter jamesrossensis TaxID=1908238 RepID=A0ABV8NMB0_9SPHI
MKTFKLNLDKLGITASTFCAIHCAIVPLLLTFLPLWGLGFLADERVEIFMIVISLLLGIWSMSSSYRKLHRKVTPSIILITGFLLIALGHFSGIKHLEPILIPFGGLAIAAAHFVNLKLARNCPAPNN